MEKYPIPPHFQLSADAIEVTRCEFTTVNGEPLNGNWRLPDPVRIIASVVFTDPLSLREVCSLSEHVRVEFVMSAHGTAVRSRLVLCQVPLEERQEYSLEGEVPLGYSDDELLVRIGLQLAESAPSENGAATKKGDLLWCRDVRHVVGNASALVRVEREDLGKRGMRYPWIVEADMSDLDRSFTEAVRIKVNSSHKLGAIIDAEQKHWGLQSLYKAVERQMRDEVDRQLVLLALSDERIRELEADEHDNSLGGVLRRCLSVLLPVGRPPQQYERYLSDPLSVEREMVRRHR